MEKLYREGFIPIRVRYTFIEIEEERKERFFSLILQRPDVG